ncbi:TetR/AcrR family transcriptional regulator [Microlunatus sp. GCM10028923]|uniref:TetR/AcrR family transcriptional regulator n=1 Tax=Microlunatus sp. GCM10028923 TaxID=3273400 RepID=UPI00360E4738
MTDSAQVDQDAPAARPGKRERLIEAACDLLYRQGFASTTLAHIAQAAEVPVGNVYYYFKTKDDIVAAVLEFHAERLAAGVEELERRHHSPRTRLKALVRLLAGRRDTIARHGCRYGTLCAELAKRPDGADPRSAPLLKIPLDWAERQFREMGRRDAGDLAVELVAGFQGSALLSSTFGQPDLMSRQARRLERWIDALELTG